MIETKTRQTRKCEIPALKDIWETVFGNIGKEAFFDYFYSPELSICVDCEGRPAAVGYLIDSGDIVNGAATVSSAMIYGVSTMPEHRGKGYGTAVVCGLIHLAHKLGYAAVVLCPSDDSLFEYYSDRTGFRDWFYVNELRYTPGVTNGDRFYALTGISPAEYCLIRETLLEGLTHIKHDSRIFEYQVILCNELNGGLFRYGSSCAVVECQQDGAVWIKELLSPAHDPDEGYRIVTAITAAFPAPEYIIRTPAGSAYPLNINHPRTLVRRYGMLAFTDKSLTCAIERISSPWYGMGFD